MDGMPTLTPQSSEQQLDLLLDTQACEPAAKACAAARARVHRRDRVSVDLRGLRARLETRAAHQQITTAALVRRAVARLFDDGADNGSAELGGARSVFGGGVVKVTLRLSPVHALLLARRARAADVSQGRYVCTLLDNMPTPPRPADLSATVSALRASTDRVAAMSVDLNAFLRLLKLGPNQQMEDYRAGLMSLADDMRAHLAMASALIVELAPSRAKR
jgi:hypothetical protein